MPTDNQEDPVMSELQILRETLELYEAGALALIDAVNEGLLPKSEARRLYLARLGGIGMSDVRQKIDRIKTL